jgi:spore coat protein A
LNPPPYPGTTTPNSAVMAFRGDAAPVGDPFTLPDRISTSFVRLQHDTHTHDHRWVAITPPGPGHPETWEIEEVDPTTVTVPSDGIVQLTTADGTLGTLRRIPRHFHDAAQLASPRILFLAFCRDRPLGSTTPPACGRL